jgi:undecaprenyl-diphosphatase
MNYINAIIFGVSQGITEFLPISSSGHLIILHKFTSLPIRNELTFDVALHCATLLAVVWFFRKDIIQLFAAWMRSFSGEISSEGKLSWFIVLATIPAMLAGVLLEDLVESVFRSPVVVAVMLIIGGIFFIIFEKVSRKTDELEKLNWKKSLLIGLAQAIALIPGTSRSGITIIAGLGVGLKREAAIRFSFLLSIPVILGASIMRVFLTFNVRAAGAYFIGGEILILAISFITAFITSLLAIKYFLRFARSYSLNIFAYYRFILAILIIMLMY